jgi:hypothetical protein
MKQLSFLAFLFLLSVNLMAAPGDTTVVRVHNAAHWSWYGNIDRWGVFPDTGKSYRKVLLKYTLGCPSGGCSDWDYTTQIILRRHTGTLDSTLFTGHAFSVGGNTPDSLVYSPDTTFTTQWSSANNTTIMVPNTAINVVLYGNAQTPWLPTDTLRVWPAGYYNDVFVGGFITDSVYVNGITLQNSTQTAYQPFEVVVPVEIARMMTPYGGNYNANWKFPFFFDVTDYANLLHDSVELRAFYGGYSDGFTVTLDFIMIEGTPPRPVHKIHTLWNGSWDYGNPANPINTHLPNISVNTQAGDVGAKLHIVPSGHGGGGADNCSEFCIKDYFVGVNNTTQFQQSIWRDDCGLNPIYPQPGTWLYDRANWCPGDKTLHYDYDLSQWLNAGSPLTVKMTLEDYVNAGNNYTSYIIGSSLITYGAPSFSLDASVEDVLAPSTQGTYVRMNPICSNPIVRIRNNGSAALTSLKIHYGLTGMPEQVFNWTGNLAFGQTQDVTLGTFPLPEPDTAVFFARVSNPNGGADGYALNDQYTTTFLPPVSFPDRVVLEVKANNYGEENSFVVKNEVGTTLANRDFYTSGAITRDTLTLSQGCYEFTFNDLGKDGLSFWANNTVTGTGYVRFKNAATGAVIRTFNSDFGTRVRLSFTVGNYYSIAEEDGAADLNAYPNPAQDRLMISWTGGKPRTLEVYNLSGARVAEVVGTPLRQGQVELNTAEWSNGLYLLKWTDGTQQKAIKVAIQH